MPACRASIVNATTPTTPENRKDVPMTRARTALASLALLVTCAFASHSGAQAPPTSANDHNLKIGVVRVSYIYRNMQESAQAFTNLKARVGQMQQEEGAKRKALEDLDNQLKQ